MPLTPSPDRVRRQALELSFASASPSPAHPLARQAPATRQHSPPHHETHIPVNSSSHYPPPGTAAAQSTDGGGKAFWRAQAQRLEVACAALTEELRTVYRLVDGQAADASHGAHRDRDAVLLQERNEARLELAREREKTFLLRHRLREMEAEVDRLQQRRHDAHESVSHHEHARTSRRARGASSSPRGPASREEPPRQPSRHSTTSSYLSSTISSSRREAPPSPSVPRRRSGTRPHPPYTLPPSPTPRPRREEAAHLVSRQRRGGRGVAGSSYAQAPALFEERRREARQHHAGASAAGHDVASPTSPPSHPRQRPASRRWRADEARALLASLLSARSASPSPSPSSRSSSSLAASVSTDTVRPHAGPQGGAEAAHARGRKSPRRRSPGAAPVQPRQRTTVSPRRVFHSSLFGRNAAAAKADGDGRRLPRRPVPDEPLPRRVSSADSSVQQRDRRLLSPTPPQRGSDADEECDADMGRVGSLADAPLHATLAARSLMDSVLGGALAFADSRVDTRDAARRRASPQGGWVVWHPRGERLD